MFLIKSPYFITRYRRDHLKFFLVMGLIAAVINVGCYVWIDNAVAVVPNGESADDVCAFTSLDTAYYLARNDVRGNGSQHDNLIGVDSNSGHSPNETFSIDFSLPESFEGKSYYAAQVRSMRSESAFSAAIIKETVVTSIPKYLFQVNSDGDLETASGHYEAVRDFVGSLSRMIEDKRVRYENNYKAAYGHLPDFVMAKPDLDKYEQRAADGDIEALRLLRRHYANPDSPNFSLEKYRNNLLSAINANDESAKLEAGYDKPYMAVSEAVYKGTTVILSSTCERVDSSGPTPGPECYFYHLAIIPQSDKFRDYIILDENFGGKSSLSPSEIHFLEHGSKGYIRLVSKSGDLNQPSVRKDYFDLDGLYLGSNEPAFSARYFRNFQKATIWNPPALPPEENLRLVNSLIIDKFPDKAEYARDIREKAARKNYFSYGWRYLVPLESVKEENGSPNKAEGKKTELRSETPRSQLLEVLKNPAEIYHYQLAAYKLGYSRPYVAVTEAEEGGLKVTAVRSCAELLPPSYSPDKPKQRTWALPLCYGLKISVTDRDNVRRNTFIIDNEFRWGRYEPNDHVNDEYTIRITKSDDERVAFYVSSINSRCNFCASASYFNHDGEYLGSSGVEHAETAVVNYKKYHVHEDDQIINSVEISNVPGLADFLTLEEMR